MGENTCAGFGLLFGIVLSVFGFFMIGMFLAENPGIFEMLKHPSVYFVFLLGLIISALSLRALLTNGKEEKGWEYLPPQLRKKEKEE